MDTVLMGRRSSSTVQAIRAGKHHSEANEGTHTDTTKTSEDQEIYDCPKKKKDYGFEKDLMINAAILQF